MNNQINTKLKYKKKNFLIDFNNLASNLLDTTFLSKIITIIESELAKDKKISEQIINSCTNLINKKKTIRIGISGVPGVGKSSFIEVFGKLLIEKGHRVAVLAVDPTSNSSKGSILGDKTRMEQLSRNADVFIRPSPASGNLGGVAKKTREIITVCEAASYDFIIIETVGVGQSEYEVNDMVDFFLLLALPAAGDDLQGIKKGIMEMADMIVVTKNDGKLKTLAEIARQDLQNALHIQKAKYNSWTIPVVKSSTTDENSFVQLYNKIINYIEIHKKNNAFYEKRNSQKVNCFYELLEDNLKTLFFNDSKIKTKINENIKQILNENKNPYSAVKEIFNQW